MDSLRSIRSCSSTHHFLYFLVPGAALSLIASHDPEYFIRDSYTNFDKSSSAKRTRRCPCRAIFFPSEVGLHISGLSTLSSLSIFYGIYEKISDGIDPSIPDQETKLNYTIFIYINTIIRGWRKIKGLRQYIISTPSCVGEPGGSFQAKERMKKKKRKQEKSFWCSFEWLHLLGEKRRLD